MTPLTAAEWLKKNYPHATGWHEDYAQEFAKDIAIQFFLWVENLTDEQAYSFGNATIHDYYTKFLIEQKEKQCKNNE